MEQLHTSLRLHCVCLCLCACVFHISLPSVACMCVHTFVFLLFPLEFRIAFSFVLGIGAQHFHFFTDPLKLGENISVQFVFMYFPHCYNRLCGSSWIVRNCCRCLFYCVPVFQWINTEELYAHTKMDLARSHSTHTHSQRLSTADQLTFSRVSRFTHICTHTRMAHRRIQTRMRTNAETTRQENR